MPRMSEIIAAHTALSGSERRRLEQILSEWQLLADLAFSDLVLWVQDTDVNVFWAVAQIRPMTGPTALIEDVVGDLIAYSPEHLVTEAFLSGEIAQTSANKLSAGIPVDVHAIPVRFDNRVIGVVEQHTNQLGIRSPSMLENSYLDSAEDLARMVASGEFPDSTDLTDQLVNPRVGDGFIRLDSAGNVDYASPNAQSAYRRLGLLGDLIDEHLATLTAELRPRPGGPVEDSLEPLLAGRAARRGEVVAGHAHLLLRSVPLTRGRERHGAIVLCRDISDVRSKERELITKNATIREIHHRVKNNLQTVAALLRMQARRIAAPEAKAALTDAMSRVAAIAIVHETLSQAFDEVVDFDQVADGLMRMVVDVAATSDEVQIVRIGSFGEVSADLATNLSMVVTELCQNAVDHGLACADGSTRGEVHVVPRAGDGLLRVEITDNGVGLPENFDWRSSSTLGLSIVSTLAGDMGGHFRLGPNPVGRGTQAVVEVPLTEKRR
ncbi:MAG: sensor histidine kinase [Microlunatus sp.]|nr:sensor histidine kinase [Microlunatus sp.]MDN5770208.1 sensor histidine kinase [Microlunatus sp.]